MTVAYGLRLSEVSIFQLTLIIMVQIMSDKVLWVMCRKSLKNFALSIMLSVCGNLCMAGEVIKTVDDNTAGKGIGGLTGVMLGAAAGGPLGALAGGLAGVWIGASGQQASGLSEQGYLVKTETGELITVRSPKLSFSPGEQVVVRGNRLHRAE